MIEPPSSSPVSWDAFLQFIEAVRAMEKMTGIIENNSLRIARVETALERIEQRIFTGNGKNSLMEDLRILQYNFQSIREDHAQFHKCLEEVGKQLKTPGVEDVKGRWAYRTAMIQALMATLGGAIALLLSWLTGGKS